MIAGSSLIDKIDFHVSWHTIKTMEIELKISSLWPLARDRKLPGALVGKRRSNIAGKCAVGAVPLRAREVDRGHIAE
jgi:hypothetical protein